MKYSEICRQREIEARQQAEYYERIPEDAQKAAGAREQREIEAYWRALAEEAEAEEAAEEELNHQTKGEHAMIHPYNKHDYLLDRDLTPAERLEPARAAARHARQLLEQYERMLERAGALLKEDELETICRAGEMALRAAENAAFLGSSGYNGQPVEMVRWKEV